MSLATLGAGLCLVPGLDVLGFHASLVVACVGSWVAGPVGAAVARRALLQRPKRPLRAVLIAAAAGLMLAVVPAVLLSLNALRVRNCDPVEGAALYAAGAGVGLMASATLGGLLVAACGALGQAIWAFFGLWLLAAAADLWHVYRHPPVFVFNPFVGFIPGAIYEDAIALDTRLAAFRGLTALELATLAAFVRLGWSSRRVRVTRSALQVAHPMGWAALTVLLAGTLVLHGQGAFFGFRMDRDAIEQELGGEIRLGGVRLVYDASRIAPAEALAIHEDHVFRIAQLTGLLGPEAVPEVLTSYVYGSAEQKRRLMGASRVQVAKPWLAEIHVQHPAVGAPVVKHELAHVLLAPFAPGLLGVPTRFGVLPHMAVVEGAAEALEWSGERLTPHQWAAALRRAGLAPDMGLVLGPQGYVTASAGMAYTLAGSFLRWFMDTEGIQAFADVYRDADFERVTGSGVREWVARWELFLDEMELPADAIPLAEARYARRPVFLRVCPFEIARLEKAAWAALRTGDAAAAMDALRDVRGFAPDDPRKILQLLDVVAAEGELAEAVSLRVALEEMESAGQGRRDGLGPTLAAIADERVADAAWRSGQPLEAAARYQVILDSRAPLSDARLRLLHVKADVAADLDLEPVVGPYLLRPSWALRDPEVDDVAYLEELAEERPHDALVGYLLGRRQVREGDRATRVLGVVRLVESAERFLGREDAYGDLVGREALFLAGRIGVLDDEPALAAAILERAVGLAPHAGTQLTVADWLARARFRKTGRVAAPYAL